MFGATWTLKVTLKIISFVKLLTNYTLIHSIYQHMFFIVLVSNSGVLEVLRMYLQKQQYVDNGTITDITTVFPHYLISSNCLADWQSSVITKQCKVIMCWPLYTASIAVMSAIKVSQLPPALASTLATITKHLLYQHLHTTTYTACLFQ